MPKDLAKKISASVLELIQICGDAADKNGSQAYLVGGAIRDALLDAPTGDLDFSIGGNVKNFIGTLVKKHNCTLARESEFQTYLLKYKSQIFDVATLRSEQYEHSGALPTIQTNATIHDDLKRRDFTINAVALSINEHNWGKLFDPFGGVSDMENKVVRIIHKQSFQNDPTRILRALRYAKRLQFQIEPRTLNQLRHDVNALNSISSARITNEIIKIFDETRCADILETARSLKVFEAILPKFCISSKAVEVIRHESKLYGRDDSNKHDIYFAHLIADLPTETVMELPKCLQLKKSWRKIVDAQVNYGVTLTRLKKSDIKPSDIYGCLATVPIAFLKAKLEFEHDRLVKKHLSDFINQYRLVKPALDGNDLLALGITGNNIGTCLEAILKAKLDSRIATRADEIAFVRNHFITNKK